MIEITWTFFKSLVSSSSVGWIYTTEPNNAYSVYVSYQGLILKCYISANSTELSEFESTYKSLGNKKISPSPFGPKEIDGKKLYKRIHGTRPSLTTGTNEVLFTVPYAWVKITSLEVVGGELGDYASFYILDSSTGTYTQVPNSILNQFGYATNIAKDAYQQRSEFDADLYINMQIKIIYNSVSNKTIGLNYILTELK